MSSAPLRDPAVERRANPLMIAVLAFVCARLAARAWVGTTLGGGGDARTVHGYGLVFVESEQKAFVSERVASKAGDGAETTVTRWPSAAARRWSSTRSSTRSSGSSCSDAAWEAERR